MFKCLNKESSASTSAINDQLKGSKWKRRSKIKLLLELSIKEFHFANERNINNQRQIKFWEAEIKNAYEPAHSFVKFIIFKGPFRHNYLPYSFKFSSIVRWCVETEIFSGYLCGWSSRKRQPLSNDEQKGNVIRDLPMTETVIINREFF